MSWKQGIALAVALVAALAVTATPARAQSDVDTVMLRDGAMVRGHVAEIRPNQSITVVLLTGETRVIPWSDFARGSGPSFPTPAEPAQPAPSQQQQSQSQTVTPGQYQMPEFPEQALLQPGPGRAPLRIESATDRAVHVGVPIGGAIMSGTDVSVTSHRRLCDAPCTLYVNPGSFSFNTSTNDISYDTEVEVPPRGVRVRMRTPSKARAGGGLWMTNGGLALLAAGGLFVWLGTGHDRGIGWYAGGGAMLGVGAGLTGGGIYLLATNRRGVDARQEF